MAPPDPHGSCSAQTADAEPDACLSATTLLEELRTARQRVAELAKANRSLRESVNAVAQSVNFDQSLAEVVLRIGTTAEASMGSLFVYDEATNTLCSEFWFEGGVLHWEPDLNAPPCMREPFDADVTLAFRYCTAQQQIMYTNLGEIDEMTRAAAWPGVIDWHLANGRHAACAIPILAGRRPLGIIGLAWTEKVVFSPEKLEMLMALTNHAELVMQLRHMERAARAVTIAREQERAAQERAAELAKANEALKKTLDVVAFEPDLNQVLGHVLASITQQLGSPSSALWLWEQESGRFRAHLVFHEGRVLKLTDENRKLLQGVWGQGRDLHWKDHIRERKPIVYQAAESAGSQERAFLQRLGMESLLGLPLLLGSEIIGSITSRFDTVRMLQPQELELAQALAHQATMAVQLTRLAERAGEAALSEERARFAREIHDTLAQGFTGILMQLGAISQIEGDQRSDIQPQLAAMTALAQSSLAEARRSIRAFRPSSAASDFRLDRAVEQFIERVRLQTTAAVTFTVKGMPPKLSQRTESELSGIVQEALNNAVNHAAAKHITVSLYFEQCQGVWISVEDDGVGFDPAARTGTDCFGLIGMQERAASIGASLTIVSERGRGAEIIVQYGQSAGPS